MRDGLWSRAGCSGAPTEYDHGASRRGRHGCNRRQCGIATQRLRHPSGRGEPRAPGREQACSSARSTTPTPSISGYRIDQVLVGSLNLEARGYFEGGSRGADAGLAVYKQISLSVSRLSPASWLLPLRV